MFCQICSDPSLTSDVLGSGHDFPCFPSTAKIYSPRRLHLVPRHVHRPRWVCFSGELELGPFAHLGSSSAIPTKAPFVALLSHDLVVGELWLVLRHNFLIRRRPPRVGSGGLTESSKRLFWLGCVWMVWVELVFGREEDQDEDGADEDSRVSVFPSELVPIVCCFTGVGSSFSVLFVAWATGVGFSWAIFLLFVSIGLLFDFFLWCHVIVIVERLRSSVEIGSSSMPKGVVEFGVSLMPKGVTCAGPSGIINLLTLVSGLSSRGFNPCDTLRLDVLIVGVKCHHCICDSVFDAYHLPHIYCGV